MNGAEWKQAIARGDVRVELTVKAVAISLRRVKPGEFSMGSRATEPGHDANESPVRPVRLTRPFYLGTYPITQGQYSAVTGLKPSGFHGDDLPVDQVTYPAAIEFCRKLSEEAGVTVTLPTEAQWEFACRAGTRTRFYSGDSDADLARVAWYEANSGGSPHPVGQKEPNAWGFYDMLGNIWELSLDHIRSYREMSETDPVGQISPNWGQMRGGSYAYGSDSCRCACRLVSNVKFGGSGLRIAINP